MELLWVSLASFLAGFIDSIVGGGGLVLVPTLFTTYPSAHPATLFGTNKGASVWGGCGVTVAGAAAGCGGVRCGIARRSVVGYAGIARVLSQSPAVYFGAGADLYRSEKGIRSHPRPPLYRVARSADRLRDWR